MAYKNILSEKKEKEEMLNDVNNLFAKNFESKIIELMTANLNEADILLNVKKYLVKESEIVGEIFLNNLKVTPEELQLNIEDLKVIMKNIALFQVDEKSKALFVDNIAGVEDLHSNIKAVIGMGLVNKLSTIISSDNDDFVLYREAIVDGMARGEPVATRKKSFK